MKKSFWFILVVFFLCSCGDGHNHPEYLKVSLSDDIGMFLLLAEQNQYTFDAEISSLDHLVLWKDWDYTKEAGKMFGLPDQKIYMIIDCLDMKDVERVAEYHPASFSYIIPSLFLEKVWHWKWETLENIFDSKLNDFVKYYGQPDTTSRCFNMEKQPVNDNDKIKATLDGKCEYWAIWENNDGRMWVIVEFLEEFGGVYVVSGVEDKWNMKKNERKRTKK